jgi:argininosuccinate lyase
VTKLWGGRFAEEPAPELMAFTESLSFDRVLLREDCLVLGAHANALARAGLLAAEEAAAANEALRAIGAGDIAFDATDEDVHSAVERALDARLPGLSPKLRAGLSRNDRVAAALRLWLLRNGAHVVASLTDLIEVLARRAREHTKTLMPGYTHLQRAQPVTLAHHLLAHAFAFERDARRLASALAGADASPLGSGALAGSTLGLDAGATADDLGFTDVMANSIDAVAARDFVAEFVGAAAILAVHCSRVGEELVLWTSAEFGFAEFADSHATGSSLMPQKKNPDIAELARGKAGRIIGNLAGLLAMLKGLPLAYNRDLQEDKEPLFDTVRTMRAMLPALSGALASLRFDAARLARAAEDGSLLATDLAEFLVRRGVAFRDAHDAVGRAVRAAAERNVTVADLTPGELAEFHPSFGADVGEILSARASVDRRSAPGPSLHSVEDQLRRIDGAVEEIRKSLA